MQSLVFLVGHHWEQWVEKGAEIFSRKKSQLTSDSFCTFFPIKSHSRTEKTGVG